MTPQRLVTIEKPVERVVYKDVEVPVQMSNERVVVREVPVAVEVIKQVSVPVEHVHYHEVLKPTESLRESSSDQPVYGVQPA